MFLFYRGHRALVENSKESTKKPLILISELSKVTGYKVNLQISTLFLYSSNTHLEIKIRYLSTLNIIVISALAK